MYDYIYVYAACAYNACGGHMKALNLPELEFHMIVSHAGAGGSDSCSLEDNMVLLTTESSP